MAGERSGYQLKFHRSTQRRVEDQSAEDYERLARFIESRVPQVLSLRQIPPDIDHFIGHQDPFDDAIALLKQADLPGLRSPIVLAIAGRAGVGKSTLAIHIAHQIHRTFADAQLYVNLRGNDPQPLAPCDVLASFLRAWGIPDASIPEGLEERSQLFQLCLAEKRTLILLDNAEDEAQVRPLLPMHGVCAVLITSRKRLIKLLPELSPELSPESPSELLNITLIDLAEMSEIAALELLQKFAPVSVQAEPDVAMSAVNHCSRLPLAICTFGHLLRSQPDMPLREAVEQLAEVRSRSKQLHLSHADIRANFMLSYRQLDPTAARLLRLLGLLVESSFTLTLASVLLESTLDTARDAIQPLVTLHLLEPVGGDSPAGRHNQRFRFVHDLIRLLVRGQLAMEESAEDRQAVRLRVCQWYWNAVRKMNLGLEPATREEIARVLSRRSRQSLVVLEQKVLSSTLSWFADERLNLLTAVEWAYQAEDWEQVIALAEATVSFYDIHQCWADWERTHNLALDASRQLNDRAQAAVLNNLGNAYLRQRQWDKAKEHYEQSLSRLATLPDRLWEAETGVNLGILYIQQEQFEKAVMLWHMALTKLPDTAAQRSLRQWMQGVNKRVMQQAIDYERDRQPSQGLLQSVKAAVKRFIFE